MNKLIKIITAAGLGLAITGCAAAHRGTTVVKWDNGQKEPVEVSAIQGGMYALYAASDIKPKWVVEVKEGESLGMQRTSDGRVKFTAGSNKLPTEPDGTYYWNYRGKKAE